MLICINACCLILTTCITVVHIWIIIKKCIILVYTWIIIIIRINYLRLVGFLNIILYWVISRQEIEYFTRVVHFRWLEGSQLWWKLTTFTQVWVFINHVYQVVLSSVLTKIVLKITWLLGQWLGPTFPMNLVCIPADLGCIHDCSGFPSSTAWLCYDM